MSEQSTPTSNARLPATVPTLEELSRLVEIPRDHLCIFLSGSTVTEWAHSKSDLDLFVVTQTEASIEAYALQGMPVPSGVVPIVLAEASGVRLDIEFWTETQIDRLIQNVAASLLPSPRRFLAEEETEFLARLNMGVALSGGSWLRARQESLRAAGFNQVRLLNLLDTAESFVEDAVGMLGRDDWSAALAIREGFGAVVDALLVHSGQLWISRKWRARQVQSAESLPLTFEEYWKRESMRGFDEDAPTVWVREMIERCRELMLEVDVDARATTETK